LDDAVCAEIYRAAFVGSGLLDILEPLRPFLLWMGDVALQKANELARALRLESPFVAVTTSILLDGSVVAREGEAWSVPP
jgi:hypothetical protein